MNLNFGGDDPYIIFTPALEKQRYIDEYYEHEGIRLDPNKIEYNPGLRALAKFALNSLWGT